MVESVLPGSWWATPHFAEQWNQKLDKDVRVMLIKPTDVTVAKESRCTQR